jgi:hypothetical protein
VSKRPKFIWFTFIGQNVPGLKKAKVSVQKPDLARFFNSAQMTIEIDRADDLTKEDIAKRLLSSGGAHMPTHYEFKEGQRIPVKELVP